MYPRIYETNLSLLTDLYQLTMAQGYFLRGMAEQRAVFHMCYRKNPFKGGFAVAAGLESLIHYLQNWRFSKEDLDYLSTLQTPHKTELFCEEFLRFLGTLRFSCDLEAVPEGTIIFPYEPTLQITGPLLQCQLLETPLLTLLNFPTLIATKALRLRLAAGSDRILEFGVRRAQGPDGSLTAARSAYLGGGDASSNVLAGKLFGIPVAGTHSHSWVMAHEEEEASFASYAEVMPDNCIFLVDTYNTLEGVQRAIRVAKRYLEEGKKLIGIRLDSGDLAYLSIEARKLLDQAGLSQARIVASNELDEYLIAELKQQGAKIDVWGVGTNLVTAKDQPALDGVYKLSAIEVEGKWQRKLKLSEQIAKISHPGILQVMRYRNQEGMVADMIYDKLLGVIECPNMIDPLDPTRQKWLVGELESEELMHPIFKGGECVYDSPSLSTLREQVAHNIQEFHPGIRRFVNPHTYPVGLERSLYNHKLEIIHAIRNEEPRRESTSHR